MKDIIFHIIKDIIKEYRYTIFIVLTFLWGLSVFYCMFFTQSALFAFRFKLFHLAPIYAVILCKIYELFPFPAVYNFIVKTRQYIFSCFD